MIHYFGYDQYGDLKSTEIKHGGFSINENFCDPGCKDPIVMPILERRKKAGINNFIRFSCLCPSSKGTCSCAANKFKISYIKDGQLVKKIDYKILVDGEEVEDGGFYIGEPLTKSEVKLVAVSQKSGVVKVKNTSGVDLLVEDEITLDIDNYASSSFTIVNPAQGSRGVLQFGNNKFMLKSIQIRGFSK